MLSSTHSRSAVGTHLEKYMQYGAKKSILYNSANWARSRESGNGCKLTPLFSEPKKDEEQKLNVTCKTVHLMKKACLQIEYSWIQPLRASTSHQIQVFPFNARWFARGILHLFTVHDRLCTFFKAHILFCTSTSNIRSPVAGENLYSFYFRQAA